MRVAQQPQTGNAFIPSIDELRERVAAFQAKHARIPSLAVLGYALGTYGAWVCAQLMRAVSPEVTP